MTSRQCCLVQSIGDDKISYRWSWPSLCAISKFAKQMGFVICLRLLLAWKRSFIVTKATGNNNNHDNRFWRETGVPTLHLRKAGPSVGTTTVLCLLHFTVLCCDRSALWRSNKSRRQHTQLIEPRLFFKKLFIYNIKRHWNWPLSLLLIWTWYLHTLGKCYWWMTVEWVYNVFFIFIIFYSFWIAKLTTVYRWVASMIALMHIAI